MPKIHPVPARKVLRALRKLGFKIVRVRGSHVVLKREDGRLTVIPIHGGEDIGRGLLRKIAYDVGMSLKEFFEFIKKDP